MVLLLAQRTEAASLTISWDPPTDPTVTGHVLWYGTQSGGYPNKLDLGLKTSYTLSGLAQGTVYYFAVTAYNAGGEASAFSQEVSGSIGGGGGGGTVGAPQNLTGRVYKRTINLQWQPPLTGAVSSYLLEAGSTSGRADLGTVSTTALTYSVSGAPDGVYYIRAKGVSAGVTGAASNEIKLVVGRKCGGPPGRPNSFTATATGGLVQVGWQPGSGETPASYVLEVGSGPGRRDLAAVSLESTSLSSPAVPGTYFLRVAGVNECGKSLFTTEAVVTVSSARVPGAPGQLTQQVSGSTVTLTWQAPSGGAERYIIEATEANGDPLARIDTGHTATSFTTSGVAPGMYIVRVRAANAAGIGPPSSPVTVVVMP